MKKLFIGLFLCVSVIGFSQIEESIGQKIDAVFDHVNLHTPGYMIGVIQDSEYILARGYGLANLEHQIPIDTNSAFNIASLSKQFTAACIALLIMEDKISLDAAVSTYIPDFPFKESGMQIKHLIYMTSGINDYYYNSRPNDVDWSSMHFFNIDTAITASLNSGELMYAPGTQWSYSNINYMLLTKIVEQVSGKSFATFVGENIFTPLGMENSFVNDDVFQVIPNRVNGYNFRDEENVGWLKEYGYLKSDATGYLQIHRNSPHYGGSGVYTSMNDLKKWTDNFETKVFGGERFYQLMHLTMKFDHDKSNDAFGLVHGDYNGMNCVWYEGGDWGWSSYMIQFPAENITVVCFSNLGTGNARKHAVEVIDILTDASVIKLK